MFISFLELLAHFNCKINYSDATIEQDITGNSLIKPIPHEIFEKIKKDPEATFEDYLLDTSTAASIIPFLQTYLYADPSKLGQKIDTSTQFKDITAIFLLANTIQRVSFGVERNILSAYSALPPLIRFFEDALHIIKELPECSHFLSQPINNSGTYIIKGSSPLFELMFAMMSGQKVKKNLIRLFHDTLSLITEPELKDKALTQPITVEGPFQGASVIFGLATSMVVNAAHSVPTVEAIKLWNIALDSIADPNLREEVLIRPIIGPGNWKGETPIFQLTKLLMLTSMINCNHPFVEACLKSCHKAIFSFISKAQQELVLTRAKPTTAPDAGNNPLYQLTSLTGTRFNKTLFINAISLWETAFRAITTPTVRQEVLLRVLNDSDLLSDFLSVPIYNASVRNVLSKEMIALWKEAFYSIEDAKIREAILTKSEENDNGSVIFTLPIIIEEELKHKNNQAVDLIDLWEEMLFYIKDPLKQEETLVRAGKTIEGIKCTILFKFIQLLYSSPELTSLHQDKLIHAISMAFESIKNPRKLETVLLHRVQGEDPRKGMNSFYALTKAFRNVLFTTPLPSALCTFWYKALYSLSEEKREEALTATIIGLDKFSFESNSTPIYSLVGLLKSAVSHKTLSEPLILLCLNSFLQIKQKAKRAKVLTQTVTGNTPYSKNTALGLLRELFFELSSGSTTLEYCFFELLCEALQTIEDQNFTDIKEELIKNHFPVFLKLLPNYPFLIDNIGSAALCLFEPLQDILLEKPSLIEKILKSPLKEHEIFLILKNLFSTELGILILKKQTNLFENWIKELDLYKIQNDIMNAYDFLLLHSEAFPFLLSYEKQDSQTRSLEGKKLSTQVKFQRLANRVKIYSEGLEKLPLEAVGKRNSSLSTQGQKLQWLLETQAPIKPLYDYLKTKYAKKKSADIVWEEKAKSIKTISLMLPLEEMVQLFYDSNFLNIFITIGKSCEKLEPNPRAISSSKQKLILTTEAQQKWIHLLHKAFLYAIEIQIQWDPNEYCLIIERRADFDVPWLLAFNQGEYQPFQMTDSDNLWKRFITLLNNTEDSLQAQVREACIKLWPKIIEPNTPFQLAIKNHRSYLKYAPDSKATLHEESLAIIPSIEQSILPSDPPSPNTSLEISEQELRQILGELLGRPPLSLECLKLRDNRKDKWIFTYKINGAPYLGEFQAIKILPLLCNIINKAFGEKYILCYEEEEELTLVIQKQLSTSQINQNIVSLKNSIRQEYTASLPLEENDSASIGLVASNPSIFFSGKAKSEGKMPFNESLFKQQFIFHLAQLTKKDHQIIKMNIARHFHYLLKSISRPSGKTSSGEIINYYAYLLHAQRLLDSLSFIRPPAFLHSFLQGLRNKIRHDSSELAWGIFYSQFNPLIENLYSFFILLPEEDISQEKNTIFHNVGMQNNTMQFKALAKIFELSNDSPLISDKEKLILYHTILKDLLSEDYHLMTELKKSAKLWLIAAVAETDSATPAYREIYRALGHAIDTPYDDLADQLLAGFEEQFRRQKRKEL